MYLLSALINHFILIIIVARFTSSTVLSHPIMVLLIREGWKDGKTPWKISNSQSCPKKNTPAKLNADYERVVQKQNPTARNTWEIIFFFFLKISICVDKMLFVLKMLKTRQFFQKRMKVCAENCPIFCKKYFSECDILCFRTCTVTTNFTVKIPVFFSGLIFFIFRQPWLLFRIWANLSSRLTSNTLFVWRHAPCDSLWPDHSGFQSPLGFCATSSSSSWAAAQRRCLQIRPGGERRDCSNSHRLRRQNAESKFGISLSFFFLL